MEEITEHQTAYILRRHEYVENLPAQHPENLSLSYIPWSYENPNTFEPFWFENLDYNGWKDYAGKNTSLALYVAGLYLCVIFVLRRFMKSRPALQVKNALVWWNILLGAFSIIAFIRTTQELVHVIKMPDGLRKSLCERIGLNRPAAFYSITFVLSKFIELGDTIFIVLRKRPLIFLHWYHHCVSLVLAWKVMPYSEPIFRYYGVMNYGVHSLMFPYFALKVMNWRVPNAAAVLITALQLLQFVVGLGINLYTAYLTNSSVPGSCARDPASIKWIGFMYASFMIIFGRFFYDRYISKKVKAT